MGHQQEGCHIVFHSDDVLTYFRRQAYDTYAAFTWISRTAWRADGYRLRMSSLADPVPQSRGPTPPPHNARAHPRQPRLA